MKRIAGLMGVALVLLAAPLFAGDYEKCSSDAQTCLDHMAAAKETKGWMGIELDKSADGHMAVKKVVEGSPAHKAGFKAGDILFALNGISYADKEAMKKAKPEMKPGSKVTVTVKRGGKNADLAVTLGVMPDDVFAQMVGGHMLQGHLTAAATSTEDKKKGEE